MRSMFEGCVGLSVAVEVFFVVTGGSPFTGKGRAVHG